MKQIKSAKMIQKNVTCGCCGRQYDVNFIVAVFEDDTEAESGSYVKSCPFCGAVNAEGINEEAAFAIVEDKWSTLPEDIESQRYYDITYYDAVGELHRRHGWYDIRDSRIVQVG